MAALCESMKRISGLIYGLLLASTANAAEYRCQEHDWYLVRMDVGFEHVNHRLMINGNYLVKELAEAMWFIENVSCTSVGFRIHASHVQYNDPTKQVFLLNIISPRKYELK